MKFYLKCVFGLAVLAVITGGSASIAAVSLVAGLNLSEGRKGPGINGKYLNLGSQVGPLSDFYLPKITLGQGFRNNQ